MSEHDLLVSLLPRYVRVSTKLASAVHEHPALRAVRWFPGFYALPGCEPLSSLTIGELDYKAQALFPMDVASALAIAALDVDPSHGTLSVLDLCCCPGNKMQLIAESASATSKIVGVDISSNRLFVCKSLLEQWQARHLHLDRFPQLLVFHADGRHFGPDAFGELVHDSSYLAGELAAGKQHKALRSKSAKAREKRAYSETTQRSEVAQLLDEFDRVLVDAECTHDASYRHMLFSGQASKWQRSAAEQESETVAAPPSPAPVPCSAEGLRLSHEITDVDQLNENKRELLQLQRDLLFNGFRRLKAGGMLVYSTCSHDDAQNEDVVRWLLSNEPAARLLPILPSDKEITPVETAALQQIAALTCFESLVESSDCRPDKRARLDWEGRSEQLRDLVCSLSRPPWRESERLPGTVRLGAEVGTSGHFIAKILKVPLSGRSPPLVLTTQAT